MTPQSGMSLACTCWIVSWIVAAFWSDPASARPRWNRESLYHIVTLVGAIILFGVSPDRWYGRALWPVGNTLGWVLVAVAVAGFAFTWWARLHLGRLWSGNVTLKAGHRVVDSGPYALVRHPIYTGIILVTIAIVVMRASMRAAAGACIMTLGWWIKAKLEERFLREELGAARYDRYAAQVPMLVPFTRP